MDLMKANNISADYKDRRSPPQWQMRIQTDVVFIDKSVDSVVSHAYLLKETVLTLDDVTAHNRMPITPDDAFMMLGEVAFVDKKNKQVFLKNENVVSYNHLVVVSGNRSLLSIKQEEFTAGLQALCDAIKVKPKIPSSFANITATPHRTPYGNGPDYSAKPETPKLDTIASPFIQSAGNRPTPFELNAINKRLFEVQL